MMNDFKTHANIAGERLLNGNPTALEEVIELYGKKIFNLAFRFTGDKDEACDLSQEIFLRLYSKIKRFSPNTDFNAWFMRLAVNAAINYRSRVRKNPSHIALEFCENLDSGTDDNTPDNIEQEARQQSVNTLLAQLPKRERMAITLQLYEKKKVKEIAELMGTSIKGAEALLTRARKRLKKIIKQNEGSR
ncbi:MAG: sigma-70 family RNA polymerase sigma factor [Candidatus Aminicenantes bacterium]|nr:sigma-70 family RNA polymerase sigma factor [Candidatus Aminicenantes bacterium]